MGHPLRVQAPKSNEPKEEENRKKGKQGKERQKHFHQRKRFEFLDQKGKNLKGLKGRSC